MIYDTHFHLDLTDNMVNLIKEMNTSELNIFAVGTTPRAYHKVKQLCACSSKIYVGLGMHPQLIGSGYDDVMLFKKYFPECHYIGEVGLDFGKEYNKTRHEQIRVFDEIVKMCEQSGGKVISVHSRKSVTKVLEIIGKYKMNSNNKYIFHWYTGSLNQLNRVIELGGFFSINPQMLKSKSGIDIVKKIPIERMVLETDAPFTQSVKSIYDIEETLNSVIYDVSKYFDGDVLKRIRENSIDIFRY